jgi:hypothetical protein
MAIRFKRVSTPPSRQPAFNDEGAQQARRLQREGLSDVVWVAIGLAVILVVGLVYEWTTGNDRRAARERAAAAARTMQAAPPAAYKIPQRYPTAEEIQADQMVREARELAAANAAANRMDPALDQQLAKPVAPAYAPTPPSLFGPQEHPAAPAAPAAAPPAAAPQPSSTPIGPPR